MEKNISSETMNLIKTHCIILKKQAEFEDNIEQLRDQKELQIRRLEDKIHKYYLNKYKDCQCFK